MDKEDGQFKRDLVYIISLLVIEVFDFVVSMYLDFVIYQDVYVDVIKYNLVGFRWFFFNLFIILRNDQVIFLLY